MFSIDKGWGKIFRGIARSGPCPDATFREKAEAPFLDKIPRYREDLAAITQAGIKAKIDIEGIRNLMELYVDRNNPEIFNYLAHIDPDYDVDAEQAVKRAEAQKWYCDPPKALESYMAEHPQQSTSPAFLEKVEWWTEEIPQLGQDKPITPLSCVIERWL